MLLDMICVASEICSIMFCKLPEKRLKPSLICAKSSLPFTSKRRVKSPLP
ncbi:Uncharacterised protein [Vibrio cholerae]|nr:Uncharacterised protein [Vibrio cholerae]